MGSNNLLKSLEGLETSWFMNRGARLLDLRGNKLTELDLQTLEPIMDRSGLHKIGCLFSIVSGFFVVMLVQP